MGGEGVEPSWPFDHNILSVARIPIPPPALIFFYNFFPGELILNYGS